jgi:hypothetical protein
VITERPAAVQTVNYIPIYLNLPKEMKEEIPGWLWNRKVENSGAKSRKISTHSVRLFQESRVDMGFVLDDLIKRGFQPIHVHLMVREHGGYRVRMMMSDKLFIPHVGDCTVLPKTEFLWFSHQLYHKVWDAMGYHNEETEHLPEVISVNCANPYHHREVEPAMVLRVVKGELVIVQE